MDDYGSDDERAEARQKDTDGRWQDIPESWIERYADVMPFLCAKSLKYYIAPFMIWALRHCDESGSFAGDAAVYILGVGDLAQEKLDSFTDAQRAVIARFLRYFANEPTEHCANRDVATAALNKYWGRFG